MHVCNSWYMIPQYTSLIYRFHSPLTLSITMLYLPLWTSLHNNELFHEVVTDKTRVHHRWWSLTPTPTYFNVDCNVILLPPEIFFNLGVVGDFQRWSNYTREHPKFLEDFLTMPGISDFSWSYSAMMCFANNTVAKIFTWE